MYGGGLLAVVLGVAAALIGVGRHWQTVRVVRPRPLPDLLVQVGGRTLEPAVTAVALVALAGVVAVLATKGWLRRVVTVLILLCGAVLLWRSVLGLVAVGPGRARSLATSGGTSVGVSPTAQTMVTVHSGWPILVLVGAVLIVLGAGLLLARSPSYGGMSSRYEAPTAAARAERAPTDAGLWNALDRGDDPTR
jgi:uncharacterized membrane protein (TIGR02234 family)